MWVESQELVLGESWQVIGFIRGSIIADYRKIIRLLAKKGK